MFPHRTHRLALTALVTAGVLLSASACASTPQAAPTTPVTTPTTGGEATAPAETPEPEETDGAVAPEDVTCENLIGADLVSEFTEQGFTAREDPFVIGDLTIDDGISCTWGDFEAETGDNLLLFGWAPLSADDAATAQTALEAEGWISEEGADGLYVTEDPAQAIAVDDDGYGMTYLFGDGWVTVSDTKQGLVLIERPTL